MKQTDVVEQVTQFGFTATVDLLTAAIEQAGMRVFARIDHAQNAREVGLNMPETLVLIYGKAAGGTPIMLAAPLCALDLPLRLLVRVDTDGRTLVAFHPIAAVLEQSGAPAAMAGQLELVQRRLFETLALNL
jgi:uncharacterized protein (DUF302 family)